MEEIAKFILGIVILILGVPVGDYLSHQTKEELKEGQKWFKLLVVVSLIGSVVSLFVRIDALLFTFSFIAIVTSRSLTKNKK